MNDGTVIKILKNISSFMQKNNKGIVAISQQFTKGEYLKFGHFCAFISQPLL